MFSYVSDQEAFAPVKNRASPAVDGWEVRKVRTGDELAPFVNLPRVIQRHASVSLPS
jgi:hypothetical protein